jgi:hypothetical protein
MTKTLPYITDRTTLDIGLVDAKSYRADIAQLERLPIWQGSAGVLSLWSHQREAIALGAAYMRSNKTTPSGGVEAALIKLPTGTGKSGVVAIVARCLPTVKRTLVLTPREALVGQMIDDIGFRFWKHMGLDVVGEKVWSSDAIRSTAIATLFPNQGTEKHICDAIRRTDRIVVVGTLQALDQIRAERDKLLRKQARGEGLSEAQNLKLGAHQEMLQNLSAFDLVVVDEGHYEPAPSWSRSVRSLRRPTILLSATPFRNDYKLFSVRGNFAYNLPFPDARDAKIVRDIQIIGVDANGPIDLVEFEDGDEERVGRTADLSTIDAFVDGLISLRPELIARFPNLPKPKIIVRARSFGTLKLIEARLQSACGEPTVLVHEQIRHEINKCPGRFVRYGDAIAKRPDAGYWLHQTKLLEGIDDSSFIAVALFDDFSNARQLVQQIGRVLRSTDPARRESQVAAVIARSGSVERVRTSWDQYLEFEVAGSSELKNIVQGEAALPQRIIPSMPDKQYVDGQFRTRLPTDRGLTKNDILLPKRAVVFERTAGFSAENLRTEAIEGIMARNRFVIEPVAGLPDNMSGWTFFTVDESPYLANHYVTEWRFGVCFMTWTNERLYVFDSDGVPFDTSKVFVRKIGRPGISKLFREPAADERIAVTRISASSLDMSDRSIRSMTTSTASFADTFSDLLDPVLLPSTMSGYVDGIGRYVGLTRSKVTDAAIDRVNVDEYAAWTMTIEAELNAGTIPNRVFERYAQIAIPDPAMAAVPRNILVDLNRDKLEDYVSFAGGTGGAAAPTGTLDYEDLCADIDAGKFKIIGRDGVPVECFIEYDALSGRYRLSSDELDNRHRPSSRTGGPVQSLTQSINSSQSFRLITDQAGVVYMNGEWVKTRDVVVGGQVYPLLCAVDVPSLKTAVTEKGEMKWADFRSLPASAARNALEAEWRQESVFGQTIELLSRPGPHSDDYGKALEEFPLVILDDDGSEIADFICVSDTKLVMLHAKANKDQSYAAVSKLQEVGRQANASLAFCSTAARVDGLKPDRWDRPYTANKTPMPGFDRVIRNADGLTKSEIDSAVRRAMLSPAVSREIWIVIGRLMDLPGLRALALAAAKPGGTPLSTTQRQLLMYIDTLTTACGRANARLRIFSN